MVLNPDPRINAFDLGDPLEFAQYRVQLVKDSLDKLMSAWWPRVKVGSAPGRRSPCCWANWLRPRISAANTSAANTRRGPIAKTRTPKLRFEPIPLTKQRDALKLLKEEILSDQRLPVLARTA